MFRCYPSHHRYQELNRISFLISAYTNPQLFPFDPEFQLPLEYRLLAIEELTDKFNQIVNTPTEKKDNYKVN